jgi:hypothetical protein
LFRSALSHPYFFAISLAELEPKTEISPQVDQIQFNHCFSHIESWPDATGCIATDKYTPTPCQIESLAVSLSRFLAHCKLTAIPANEELSLPKGVYTIASPSL